LVIGNEVSGVSQELQSLSDAAIEIEMDGIKNSLNVAVAFGIAAYQLRSQLKVVSKVCRES
jgi:tRNA G18 (ribose-2'-O)-methylase SpoU